MALAIVRKKALILYFQSNLYLLRVNFGTALSPGRNKRNDYFSRYVGRGVQIRQAMNKENESVDVLKEPVSYEMSLYFLRHFSIALEKMRKQEIERHAKKLSDREKELAEEFTAEYIRRIIDNTARQLRAMSGKGDVKDISITFGELFNAESPVLQESSLRRRA